ncbi:hypothetical protein IMZ48_45515 [Candidatus Bathyarchaeota archaeon]|nr:hypothetical protein [Candidatus Bathyarchaeota archaeon]
MAVGDEMISMCIAFLQCSDYIKNPYLKSSLVHLLFNGTWPTSSNRNGILGDQLTMSKFANDHLLHALMKFYIECESTGAHNQFYDKFNIRYEIFQVIKCVWRGNEVYSRQLTRESKYVQNPSNHDQHVCQTCPLTECQGSTGRSSCSL